MKHYHGVEKSMRISRYPAVQAIGIKIAHYFIINIAEQDWIMKEATHSLSCKDICKLLQDDKIEEVNAILADIADFSLAGANLRSANLHGLHVDGLDFSNAYFRSANLKGLDMRRCNLEGASLHGAKIAGVYFPDTLAPEEILLSVMHGTRLRHKHSSSRMP
jgi:hypothetical protein